MKIFTLFFTLLLFNSYSFSQKDHPFVKLEEKVTGKRVELFAVNTNDISYDIFLKVETEDFRRSSTRPILKTIPPDSKIKLITMVKLANKEGVYNTTFLINEVDYLLKVNKDFRDLNISLDEAINAKKKVTLYTKDDCAICPNAKIILKNNQIPYDELNIENDTLNTIKLLKDLKSEEHVENNIVVPILKIEDKVYRNIETLQDFIEALKDAYSH